MNNDSNLKGKFYQIKTLSEKSMPGKEMAKSLQLTKLIETGQVQNLKNFLEKESPSPQMLSDAISSILKMYSTENNIFYEILHLLLINGASVNTHIVYQGKKQIKKEEKITLLMFGIINNDINLINLVLNFNPDIEQKDCINRTALIYAIIFNDNDSLDIVNILIKNKANINYSLNLQISLNSVQYHSVLSLACAKDLVNIVKCLLDNNVDTNFKTQPEGDSCLHLAVKNSSPRLVGLLLSYPRINPNITNNKGKKAVDIIKSDENEQKIKNIFSNYYNNFINLNNIKINNQNQYQEGNMNLKNINFLNNSGLNNNIGNNTIPQINNINQIQQMNQIQFKVNNGKIINPNNSPNINFNYVPQGMNIGIQNNGINNKNINFNNLGNNNIQNNNFAKNYNNNDSSDGSSEDEKNNNNIINNNIPLNYINNKNYQNKNNNNKINNNENNNMNININNNESKYNKSNLGDFVSNSNVTNSELLNDNNNNNFDNNINKKLNHINQFQINLLKNNLYNKLLNNSKINYNLVIPVEFQNNSKIKHDTNNNYRNMGKFIKQNDTPLLIMDLTNTPQLEKELKLIKLNEEKEEKNKKIKEKNDKVLEKEDEIKKKKKKEDNTKNNLEYYKALTQHSVDKLNELKKKKKELIAKIPPELIFTDSNKNISSSRYRNLKFEKPPVDDNYLFKILQKDLIDYEKYINYIIYKKIKTINTIINKLKLIIEENFPDYELKVYGSYAHGLSLPWSDLNLILVNKNINNNNNDNVKGDNITDIETTVGEKTIISENQSQNDNNSTKQENTKIDNSKEKNDLLIKLYYILKKNNWINNLKLNNNEELNTIIFEVNEEKINIEINICIESENHNGLKVVELIKSYLKEYSSLKPLIFALGAILKNANLNIPSLGGLSSYGLILMIVSFIQSQRENINIADKEYIIGKTFYEFLLHYGIRFDFNKYVILTYKINDTNTPLNDKENIGQNAKEFMIVDPLNNKNNVAKSTFQFMNIKMAFMISFMVTKEDCECGCHYGKGFYENSIYTTEHCYLKRMFNSVKRFTENKK